MKDLFEPMTCQWVRMTVPKTKVKYHEDSPGYYLISKSSEGSAIFAFRRPMDSPLPPHLALCDYRESMKLEETRKSVQGLNHA